MIVVVTPASDEEAPQSCRNHAIPDGLKRLLGRFAVRQIFWEYAGGR